MPNLTNELPGPSKVDPRTAVESVLKLMGRSGATTGAVNTSGTVPSARARQAIEKLVAFGAIEPMNAAQLDMKALCRDLFDWGVPANQTKATKAVVKAVAEILLASGPTGASAYPQAVEMLAFASAASPLLEPDRLLRLLAHAPEVSTAFAPQRYTLQLAGALRRILGRYPEQRREMLLISLWLTSHQGRWWDMTSGVVTVKVGHVTRARGDEEKERRAANAQALREVLAGAAPGTEAARETLTDALLDGELAYNGATAPLITALPDSPKLRTGVAKVIERAAHGDIVDPDKLLFFSSLSWLAPGERPESPGLWLVKMLAQSLTQDLSDPVVDVSLMPEKPKSFPALFPEAAVTGFPFPNAVYRLHQLPIAGTTLVVEVVANAAELAANRDYMGNCTYSYKSRMDSGASVLLKVWDGGDCYNAMLNHNPGAWQMGEINSRHNGGGVPDPVRAAVVALAAALPPPGPLHEIAEVAAQVEANRQVGYRL